MTRFMISLLLLLAVSLPGCRGADREEPEHSALRDYVNTPKERARAAGESLENAQKRAKSAMQALDE